MAVQWLLVCHGMVTLMVVISFLCGQWPIFKGTPFQWIHYFLTFGAYDYFLYSFFASDQFFHSSPFDFGSIKVPLIVLCGGLCRRFIGLVFGSKGTDVIMSVEYFCCERPNPILQVSLIFVLFGMQNLYRHCDQLYSQIFTSFLFLGLASRVSDQTNRGLGDSIQ